MTRRGWVLLVFLTLNGLVQAQEKPTQAPKPTLLEDSFQGPLDLKRWSEIRLHDTKKDRIGTNKGNLVLALNTLGTDDKTVKLRGIRSKRSFTIRKDSALKVEVTLNWNEQSNGSYLTMGVALVRAKAKVAPRHSKEALAFEFVGVPPGKNARPYLWYRKSGGLQQLYTEGWPQPRREDRKGRRVQRARISLLVSADTVRLQEDDREPHTSKIDLKGEFQLLLFVTGHSNYGLRSVIVEDLKVSRRTKPVDPKGVTRPKQG